MTQSIENYALTQTLYGESAPVSPQYPGFLSDAQKQRLECIRQMRLLFGDCESASMGLSSGHMQYYLIEGRTKFDFPYVRTNGALRRMYLEMNLLGLISVKLAGLLFGEAPLLDCENQTQWDALQAIARRSRLHSTLLSAAMAASAEGEAFLESMIHTDGQVYCRQIDNDEIFPQGEIQPDGQYASYVRYCMKNVGTDRIPLWILLQSTITAGAITRECWQLDRKQNKQARLPLASFDPALAGQDVTQTGLDQPTVIWIPNRKDKAVSDYRVALDAQDKLNAKNTQLSRVIQKHSDPKLAAPAGGNDARGNMRADMDLFYFRTSDEIPQYIVWNAELAAAMQDRNDARNELLVRTETSPALLGLKDGAAPDSYKKVRLESFNTLDKSRRKAIDWTAGVQRLMDLALALDNTRPGVSYPSGEDSPVGVTLRDGIPIDDNDQANTISILRAAGVMSKRRAVQMQLGDESAVDAEMQALEEEAAAAAPTVQLLSPERSGKLDQSQGSDSVPASEVSGAASGGDAEGDADEGGVSND